MTFPLFCVILFAKNMRRLKKKIFYGLCGGTVAVLGVVRFCNPDVVKPYAECVSDSIADVAEKPVALTRGSHHRVRGVYSYEECFPDVQDVQIVAARRWGVRPVQNRQAAEHRKQDLVYVGANPYYHIDRSMSQSIPYLVPRASGLLQKIGRNFIDSLYVKNIPLHRIIVSSVLRTEDDVARLRQFNGNAKGDSRWLLRASARRAQAFRRHRYGRRRLAWLPACTGYSWPRCASRGRGARPSCHAA